MGDRVTKLDERTFDIRAERGCGAHVPHRQSLELRLAHRCAERPEPGHVCEREHARDESAVRTANAYQRHAEAADEYPGEILRSMGNNQARWLVVLLMLATTGAAGQQSQPQSQPTFRAATRLIVTTVAVKDPDGQPV